MAGAVGLMAAAWVPGMGAPPSGFCPSLSSSVLLVAALLCTLNPVEMHV